MIEIHIPAPCGWLNLNQRTHWALKAKLTKEWRNAAHVAARAAHAPQGLPHVHITAHIHKTTSREYDAHNLIPTIKACIDGLVDYGLTEDDTNRYVTGPDMRHGEKRKQLGITLTIEPKEGG